MTPHSMLGIDIGTANIRLALAHANNGEFHTGLFATKPVPSGTVIAEVVVEPELVATSLEEMLDEYHITEKRCVCAIGTPSASLRTMHFPAMTAFERTGAARLEIERERGSADALTVRVHPHGEAYLVGAASSRAITSRTATVAKAGLRLVAIDYAGAALCDAFPGIDAIADIGSERCSLYALTAQGEVLTTWTAIGGEHITEAISHDLTLDRATAESRKRILGAAGAGESAIRELVEAIAEGLEFFRRKKHAVDRMTVVGNAARLPGLLERIEQRCAVSMLEVPPAGLSSSHFPEDLARAIRTDCALAVSLARWWAR